MKRSPALSILALALIAHPAWAAEEAKEKPKCDAEATVCIRKMADDLRQRGWIGIEWHTDDGRPTITHVVEGSPAAAAGVRVDDVVLAFNGVPTDDGEEAIYQEIKRSLIPGNTVTLSVARSGARRELEVELVAVPEHIMAQWVGKHVLEYHSEPAETADSP